MAAICKVFIVSSNERLQAALSRLLRRQQAISYVGSSAGARAALLVIRRDPPDVVMSDSPPGNAQDVLIWRQIREHAHVLMWTHYRRESDIVRAVIAGASGLMLALDDSGPGLLEAVLSAARGISYMPQETLTRLRAVASGQAPSTLEEGERALLAHIVDGRRDADIGREMGLTSEEVPAYIARILDKLV